MQGDKEEESQDAENVSTAMVHVNSDTRALAVQVAQLNSGLGAVGVPAPAQSLNQVFTLPRTGGWFSLKRVMVSGNPSRVPPGR